MRRAFSNIEILREEKSGHFVGISFGYDFVAEHEWGISDLRYKLGMPSKKQYDNFSDLIVPPTEKVHLYIYNGYTILTSYEPYQGNMKEFDRYTSSWNDADTLSFWDSGDFLFAVKNENHANILYKLQKAFREGKVVLNLSGRSLLGGAGICLYFLDKVPEQIKKDFNKACNDRKSLEQLVESTGIKTRLREAGKSYFALSPEHLTDRAARKTKYGVIFWLNPTEQHDNNYGWFTVEELDQWIAGVGPIPVKRKFA